MGLGYRLLRSAASLLLAFQTRLEISGVDRLPGAGPLLLVSNHLGMTDQLAIGAHLPHELRILAKAELFEWPIIGWLARRGEVVPIRRGAADREALRSMLELLEHGAWVLVFPEGTYAEADEPLGMLPVKLGAAWLAWHTAAMIVPVAITGTEVVWSHGRGWRLWHRPRVRVTFGEPYMPIWPEHIPPKAAWRLVADEMAMRIAELLPEEYRGAYAQPATGVSAGPSVAAQSMPQAQEQEQIRRFGLT
jgi:1-acyl-sn-glycerol-3-phosphate acyltransferase